MELTENLFLDKLKLVLIIIFLFAFWVFGMESFGWKVF